MRRALGLAAVGLVLMSACSATSNNGAEVAGFTAGDGTVTIVPKDQREVAPKLEGTTLDGETLSTEQYLGKPVVLNVWGSWCAPCRAEAPELTAAHAKLGDSVAFIGVNTRDLDTAPAIAFERAFSVTYPSLYDPDGALLLGFGQLPPKAIPSTLVLDSEGRVAARVLGQVDAVTLEGIIGDVEGG